MQKQLWIDTDIGDDVDDALALAFALRCPSARVVGVSTVYKNTARRAQLASQLCAACGAPGVPVYAGAAQPLAGRVDAGEQPPQCRALQPPFDTARLPADGPAALVQAAERCPQLTVVALGCLTNIALAVQRAPQVMRRCKLVLMGGMTTRAYPEGNITSDPEAAQLVFESGMDILQLGLEVTLATDISQPVQDALFARRLPGDELLQELVRLWKKYTFAPMLARWGTPPGDSEGRYCAACGAHDCMAVAAALRPELFCFEKTHILVETQGRYTRGVTVEDRDPFSGQPGGGNVLLAKSVDVPAFLEFYLASQQ